MIPILQFNELSPEDILNRDIRQETGVDEAVDAVLAAVRERGGRCSAGLHPPLRRR